MKNLFKIIVLILMGLFINSCYYDAFPEDLEPIDPEEEVSYSKDIMPLWKTCVGCHKGNEPPDLRPENSYDSLLNDGYVKKGNSAESVLYQSLIHAKGVVPMPDSQWPDSKTDLVKSWIDQGAKNN